MSSAFSHGAQVLAYVGVAGTTSQASYNFLRNFANAPAELQAFLDEYEGPGQKSWDYRANV
jgi:hypothetical protein